MLADSLNMKCAVLSEFVKLQYVFTQCRSGERKWRDLRKRDRWSYEATRVWWWLIGWPQTRTLHLQTSHCRSSRTTSCDNTWAVIAVFCIPISMRKGSFCLSFNLDECCWFDEMEMEASKILKRYASGKADVRGILCSITYLDSGVQFQLEIQDMLVICISVIWVNCVSKSITSRRILWNIWELTQKFKYISKNICNRWIALFIQHYDNSVVSFSAMTQIRIWELESNRDRSKIGFHHSHFLFNLIFNYCKICFQILLLRDFSK